jgi:hypothetical protein
MAGFYKDLTEPNVKIFRIAFILFLYLFGAPCHAEVALLMEEPYGQFGAFNPTGHAAVYLSGVCADSPVHLRPCHAGEFGVIISRYHKIHHRDWIAIPIAAYLYAIDDGQPIPASVDKSDVFGLRAAYWREHLQGLAPSADGDNPPPGEWTQLVGASFDRKILGFAIDSTQDQDERFIRIFNGRRNVGHFNLFFHNCADFSRVVLDTYYPHAIHRNVLADFGMTTPRQAAVSLVHYGRSHPELEPLTFEIEQVPGGLPRSHRVDGVSEALVKSKRYLIPLAILEPEVAGVILADYIADGRGRLPRRAHVFTLADWRVPTVDPLEADLNTGEH